MSYPYEDALKLIVISVGRIAGHLDNGLTITPSEAANIEAAAEELAQAADWMDAG